MNNQTDFFYYTLNLEDILKYTVFEIKKTGPYYFEINSSNPSQYDFNAYYIYQQFIGLPNYTQKVFSYFEDTNNIFLEHIKLGRSVIQSFSSKLLVQEYIEFQNNIQTQTYDTTMELNNDLLVATWSIPIEPYTKTEIFTYNWKTGWLISKKSTVVDLNNELIYQVFLENIGVVSISGFSFETYLTIFSIGIVVKLRKKDKTKI